MNRRRRGAIVLALAILGSTACGKKGPPQPPIRILPAAAKGLKLRQAGSEVVLTATLPMEETNGTPITGPIQVKILRMPATDTLRPGFVSERYLQHQFERSAQTLATLAGDTLAKAAPGGRLTYRDAPSPPGPSAAAPAASAPSRKAPAGTPPAGSAPAGSRTAASGSPASATYPTGPRLLYSLLIVDPQGKRSMLPVPAMIEIGKAPAPPHNLKVEVQEGKVLLTWEPGEGEPAKGGFNVYRAPVADRDEPLVSINPNPIQAARYQDETIQYGAAYRYLVRAVSGRTGTLCESVDSPEVEVHPLDIYPPKAPTGVAVSAEGPVIRIYWFPNGETDLGGYRIYRRETSDGEFKRVGEVGPTETAFADATARAGVRYHYVVSAFDGNSPANESPRSEERSETLPLEGAPGAAKPSAASGGAPAAAPNPVASPSPAPHLRR